MARQSTDCMGKWAPRATAGVCVMLLALAALLVMPPAALAYNAPTKWNDLSLEKFKPQDGIPAFSTPYNNLKISNISISSGAGSWEFKTVTPGSGNAAFIYLCWKTKLTSTGKKAPGAATLTCKNSCKALDGQLLDMKLTLTPTAYISASSSWGKSSILSVLMIAYNKNTKAVKYLQCPAAAIASFSSTAAVRDNYSSTALRTRVDVELTKQDGSAYNPTGRCAYYSFGDLDVMTQGYVDGAYKSSYTDFSGIGDGKGYNEGVQFLSGVQSINVQKKSYLTVSDSYSKYAAGEAPSGTDRADDPADSVIVKTNASGFSFIWQGSGKSIATNILKRGLCTQYKLVVKKSSSDSTYDRNCAGAVYGVYSDKACTKLFYSATCDKSGTACVLADGQALVYDTTYYLKETKAPPGYALDTTIYPFDVVNAYSYVSYGTSTWVGNGTYEDITVNVKDDPLRYKVVTSVVNGSIDPTVTGLNWGTDKTVSYAPKDGYTLKSVTVDGSEVSIEDFPASYAFTDIRTDHTVDVVYEPAPVPFSFTKVDATNDAPLAGASFELYACRDAFHTCTADHSETATGEVGCCWDMEEPLAEATSAADGVVDLGELAAGEYMLVETAAPDGYQLPYGQWLVGCDVAARSISLAARGDSAPPAFKRDADTGAYSLLNYRVMVLPLAGAGFTADGLTLVAAVLLTFVVTICAWRLSDRRFDFGMSRACGARRRDSTRMFSARCRVPSSICFAEGVRLT